MYNECIITSLAMLKKWRELEESGKYVILKEEFTTGIGGEIVMKLRYVSKKNYKKYLEDLENEDEET